MKALIVFLATALLAAAAGTNESTNRPALTINAKFSRFDLKNNIFVYSNNVPVFDPSNNVTVFDPPAKPGDPPTTLSCVWLIAKRAANGKIESIVAHERVQIDQGDRHARGALAVYTATNEQMVLTGAFDPSDTNSPAMPALFSPQGNLFGPKIVYDRRNDQLVMPEGVTTHIPQSTLSSTNRSKTNKTVLNEKLLAPKPESPPPN
jgi:lipopolysaccharide export system protein LptA